MNRLVLNRLALWVLALLTSLATASAQKVTDAEEERLYQAVLAAFDNSDSRVFYEANNAHRQYALEKGYEEKYYNSWNNEILYDINNDRYYQALRKTEELEALLQKNGATNYYHVVNYLMGVFYGTRENNGLCRQYLMKALEQTDPEKNNNDQVAIYQMLANISIFEDGYEGYKWADKAIAISKNSYGLCGSLGMKAMVALTHRDKPTFDACYASIDSLREAEGDNFYPIYEAYTEMGRHAFDGQYDEALAYCDSISSETERLGFRAVIYHMKGDQKAENDALIQLINAKERRNNEISVLTVKEISRDIELNNERRERHRAELWTIVFIFITLGITILLLAYFSWTRRLHLKEIEAQNRELARARDHAQESDRMKTAFIRNVSHQIRTPLNAVAGFSEILAKQIDELPVDEREDLAQRIEHNTSVITNSLNHLITLSEAESINFAESIRPVRCNAFCGEIARTFRPMNDNLRLAYTTAIGDETEVNTNADMLRSIILELLVNADKFAKEGKIVLDSRLADDQWQISVTDRGDGIPEESMDSIFGQFTKIDDFSEGLGIGLTFCKNIALRLGGDVTLDRDYRDGARFVVSIPRQVSEEMLSDNA